METNDDEEGSGTVEVGHVTGVPPSRERTVLHVDVDCFYVSCHVAMDPRLAGRPLAVAGDPRRRHGVVLCASYEARRRGVQAPQTLAEARRRCPGLTVLRPDFALYRALSARFVALLGEMCPVVEPASVDEAYCDLTGCDRALGPAAQVGEAIRRRAREALGLPCSVGVGPNRLLAKVASRLAKPGGLVQLAAGDVFTRLWPLPVQALPGVGPALAARLAAWNVRTVGDIAALGPEFWLRRMGQGGRRLWCAACGRDDAPVCPDPAPPRSIGHSVTLAWDVRGEAEVRAVLQELAERVAERLRRHGLMAAGVRVSLTDHRLRTHARSRLLAEPVDSGPELLAPAFALARTDLDGITGFRRIGLIAARLREARYCARRRSLFDAAAEAPRARRRAVLDRAADQLRARFGPEVLMPAALLRPAAGGGASGGGAAGAAAGAWSARMPAGRAGGGVPAPAPRGAMRGASPAASRAAARR